LIKRSAFPLIVAVVAMIAIAQPVSASHKAVAALVPLPSDRLHFGLTNLDITWMKDSGVPWRYRYQYLSAGVNTGNGWETWQDPALPPGQFAVDYMATSTTAPANYIPVFTYYELLQSLPSSGSSEAQRDFNNLNTVSTMNSYYANFKLLMQKAGAYGGQVVVHVEPDFWGYMQQQAAGGGATAVAASVKSSNFPEASAFADNLVGFASELKFLRDTYAPNALLAMHASMWSSGIDLASNTDASINAAAEADKTSAFLNSAGAGGWDAIFNDVDDHDAGWWEVASCGTPPCVNPNWTHWWDPANVKFPNFSRYLAWVGELHTKTSRPQVVWQVPVGNQYFLTMNNTNGHFQDNVASYFIGHASQLSSAGLVAVLFGAGNQYQTSYDDAMKDGITNNSGQPTTDTLGGCSACNTHTSTWADDDGGYLRIFVGQYYSGTLPTWSASYDLSKVPTTWAPGQSKTFQVTVTNTGNQTWPSTGYYAVDLDLHFATSPGGSANIANWLNSTAFPLPGDLAPSVSVAVTVTFAAPSNSGSLVLEAEMIKEHQFWFQQWSSVPVTVTGPTWSASYDLSNAPPTWAAGQSQTFQVTVTNTGNQTWLSTGYNAVDFDLHFTTVVGGSSQSAGWLNSKAFSLPADLAPSGNVTFSVTFAAPSTAGSMFLEAEMIKEHQFWFTQVSSVAVTVTGPTWSASYDMSKAPASWVSGQSQTFQVTVTNTGNQTWPSTGYNAVDFDLHFTTVTGGSAQQASWLNSQAFSIPGDLPPSASVILTVTFAAPTKTGSMFLEAEMIKEHQFWFTQVSSTSVTVAAPVWSATYDLSKAPASWVAGQSQTFAVTVTNNGNQTWPSTGYNEVDIDFHFTTATGGSAQIGSWKTSQALSIPADLKPGSGVMVTVTVTAPSVKGSMFLEVEMIKEHQFWFTQVASVPVTVS